MREMGYGARYSITHEGEALKVDFEAYIGRFALCVDGKVAHIHVDDSPCVFAVSGAQMKSRNAALRRRRSSLCIG